MYQDNIFNELIRANCAYMAYNRKLTTVAQLDRAYAVLSKGTCNAKGDKKLTRQ